ncbi:probable pectinesterase 29 [Macadamia integrifolia]|uniref:probable pectinesterase 29 n=1 Tax=Macadamia integrifolia TaxID=60698 RepID=UPI001C4EBF7B|nr:probable pectinesterase 29 [Macadamia integrifolia]
MWFSKFIVFISMTVVVCSSLISAKDCKSNVVSHTIFVDQSGTSNFTTIQAAIDSVPSKNSRWIRIFVQAGFYREQVTIEKDKSCILLEGVSRGSTYIQYDAHHATNTSATFHLMADNFVAKNISFENIYNLGPNHPTHTPAVAALIRGDKASFHSCSFKSLQDTLWDERGRHYFSSCFIQGAIDFIFGGGQSLYEQCVITVTARDANLPNGSSGYITAQRRYSPNDPNGFVFKSATVVGNGRAYLGRAWGPYSRVIFARSSLSKVVDPIGWDAWYFVGHERNLTYVEADCTGKGSNTSKRVKWEKKMNSSQLRQFINLSFIDQPEGWVEKQPL